MTDPVNKLNPLRCFAVTAPGLEAIAAAELGALGVPRRAQQIVEGGVEWSGDQRSLYAANLQLRSASRVLVRIAEFRVTEFWELERRARQLPWERWIASGTAVGVRATCRKSRLYHSDAVAQRVTDAIARRVGGVASLPSVAEGEDEEGSGEGEEPSTGQLIIARLNRDLLTLSVDASGALLHRRGYRQAIARAPLRETIAAAILLAVGWRGDTSLLDPMCGSGTIPIEGAMIARGIAPGLARATQRAFAFLHWPDVDESLWSSLVAGAQSRVRESASVPIVAADQDAGAIAATRGNAERAGVEADLTIVRRPVDATVAPASRGWLVSNPPYGVRVGEDENVRALWSQLGGVVRALGHEWSAALLSPHPALDRATGLALMERATTRNGGIGVRLMASR